MRCHVTVAVVSALVGTCLCSAAGAATQIRAYVLAGGGGTAQAITHKVVSTLGQAITSPGGGSPIYLASGFWGANPTVTAADDDLPEVTRLGQNHPNPFNPRTMIVFELAEDVGDVHLSIYDARGRRVRNLTNGSLTPGRHEVPWLGDDDAGMPVSSGVYIYQLQTPTLRLVRKMTLLR